MVSIIMSQSKTLFDSQLHITKLLFTLTCISRAHHTLSHIACKSISDPLRPLTSQRMDATTSISTTSGSPLGNTSPSPSTPSASPSTTTYTPSTCLFCPHASPDIDSNIQHMSKSHNFFIPDLDHLIDVETFLAFLNTIISEFHECLFCGTARSNKWAIQGHMKSKGHCRIDLDDEYEEWDAFWDYPSSEDGEEEDQEAESSEDEGVTKRVDGDNELHLPTGKTLGHRSHARQFRQNPNRTPLSPPSPSRPLHSNRTLDPSAHTQPSTSTALSIRAGTSTSLIGVPELQQRALRTTEKKTMQVETRVRNSYRSGLDRRGNVQKFFVVLRRRERVPGSV